MKMVVQFMVRLLGPATEITRGDRWRLDLAVDVVGNLRRVFRCLRKAARRYIRTPMRRGGAGDLSGQLRWRVNGMAHQASVGLPGLFDLCSAYRVDAHRNEGADFYGRDGGRNQGLGCGWESVRGYVSPKAWMSRPVAVVASTFAGISARRSRMAREGAAFSPRGGLGRQNLIETAGSHFMEECRERTPQIGSGVEKIFGLIHEENGFQVIHGGVKRYLRAVNMCLAIDRQLGAYSNIAGELFMRFSAESSGDARVGFAEARRRRTNIHRRLRSLRERVKSGILNIAQQIRNGQLGFPEGALMVEHPSGDHCFSGLLEPLVDQSSDLPAEIGRMVESRQFKTLQRRARGRPKVIDRGSDARYGHGQLLSGSNRRNQQI